MTAARCWRAPATALLVIAALAAPAGAAARQRPAHGTLPFLGPPPASPFQTQAPAHTYTVTTTADNTDAASCASGGADCSLRAAILSANRDGTLDRIIVPAGTYALTIPPDQATYDDARSGDLDITDPAGVEVDGAGAGRTVVDASGLGDRVLSTGAHSSYGRMASAALSGLTLQHGATASRHGGGAVFNTYYGVLTLTDVTVADSSSVVRGGGIENDGVMWLTDSTVSGNSSQGDGGGLYQEGQASIEGTTFDGNHAHRGGGGAFTNYATTVRDSRFTGNRALLGGGLANTDNTLLDGDSFEGNRARQQGGGVWSIFELTARNTTISGNTASTGGGLFNNAAARLEGLDVRGNAAAQYGGGLADGRVGSLTLAASTVAGNSAWVGGGVSNGELAQTAVTGSMLHDNVARYLGGAAFANGYLSVDQSTIVHNRAAMDGGGISDNNAVRIDDSTIAHNAVWNGGGGAVAAHNETQLLMTNDTLADNRASDDAGAIEVSGATVLLTEVTIAGNRTDAPHGGGGFWSYGVVSLVATIVADNTAAGQAENCARGSDRFFSLGYNIDSGTTCGFGFRGDQSDTDPRLGPLGDYGGPTQTMPLLPGSPAIDHAGAQCATSQDQRGEPRPARRACDVGAFEAQ